MLISMTAETLKKISSCVSAVGLDEGNRYLQTNQPYVTLTSPRCGKVIDTNTSGLNSVQLLTALQRFWPGFAWIAVAERSRCLQQTIVS